MSSIFNFYFHQYSDFPYYKQNIFNKVSCHLSPIATFPNMPACNFNLVSATIFYKLCNSKYIEIETTIIQSKLDSIVMGEIFSYEAICEEINKKYKYI